MTPRYIKIEWETMSLDDLKKELARLNKIVRENRYWLTASQYNKDKNKEWVKYVRKAERDARELGVYYRSMNQHRFEGFFEERMRGYENE